MKQRNHALPLLNRRQRFVVAQLTSEEQIDVQAGEQRAAAAGADADRADADVFDIRALRDGYWKALGAPETAADALRRENVGPETVHVTGNTVIDALHWTRGRIESDARLAAELDEVERRFADKRIVLVTTHRRENFGGGMESIARAIDRIAERPDVAVLFPVHPNPNVASVMDRLLGHRGNVARVDPLDYPHFIRALGLCHLALTDSGGVQEEAPALGKPVLVMRETTERPEGVAAGTAKLVGSDEDRIVSEVFTLLDDSRAYQAMARAHNPFGDGHAAGRIAEVVARGFGI